MGRVCGHGFQQVRNRKRVAIWSVPEDWQRLYFFLFSTQFLAASILIAWHKAATRGAAASWPEVLIDIGQTISSVTIGIAAESYVATEVVVVLSEWYREWRYNRGVADGLAQGITQGAEQTQKMWEEWLRRKETAEAEGREFDEPPPKPELPAEKK